VVLSNAWSQEFCIPFQLMASVTDLLSNIKKQFYRISFCPAKHGNALEIPNVGMAWGMTKK
jgi:hypothetical protein